MRASPQAAVSTALGDLHQGPLDRAVLVAAHLSAVIGPAIVITDRARRAVGRRDPVAEADHSAFEKRRVSLTIVAHRHGSGRRRNRDILDPRQPAHGRVDLGQRKPRNPYRPPGSGSASPPRPSPDRLISWRKTLHPLVTRGSSDMTQKVSIGEASRSSGVKVPTIRYYEQIGLLPAPPRTESNRRTFDARDLRRLAFIRHARELGFEIDAIRTLLTLAGRPGPTLRHGRRDCTRAPGGGRAAHRQPKGAEGRARADDRELPPRKGCRVPCD